MRNVNSKYDYYFEMGREAYLKGMRCAPAGDPQYMDGYNHQWLGAEIGDEKSREADEAADAWVAGWTMENLKDEYQDILKGES